MKKRYFIDSSFPLGTTDILIGRRMKAIRNRHRLSAVDLGREIGLSAQQVYQIEAGKRHLYSHELITMCVYLNLKPLDLFDNFGQRSRE